MKYTTQTFLDRVAVKAAIPIGQTTFTSSDLLDLANQELQAAVLPEILRTREDYYLTDELITVKGGQELIEMPERAIAGKINDIQLINSNNNRVSLPRITTSEIRYTSPSSPNSFYFKGDFVGLNPTPSSDTRLLISYYARPSALVLPEQTYRIKLITDDSSDEIYYEVDRPLDTLGSDDQIDILSGSGLHQVIHKDITIDYIDHNRVYLTNAPDNITVGSYVVPAGQSSFIQCPQELYPWLEELVVTKIHESNGDFDAMKLAQEKANLIREQILSLLTPRAETESQIISNRIWGRFS